MPAPTFSVAEESKAMMFVTALCNSFEDLISDYGILVGAFSIDNPQIRKSFSSRGFTTSEKLLTLEDRARSLKSEISKAENRDVYGEAVRNVHQSERERISFAFLELSENLRELKKDLEGKYSFKYLPGCSYKILGELGTPSITPTERAGNHRVKNTQTTATAEPWTNSQPVANNPLDESTSKSKSALDDTAEPEDPVQSPQKPERKSTRVRKPSATSAKEEDITAPYEGKPRAIKTRRPRYSVKMGIAEKVANTRLNIFDLSFIYLAPNVRTPQQIWKHRFPEGWSQTASEEYTRALEQQIATARLELKIQKKSKAEISKKLKVAKADNAKLERELHFAKVVFAQKEDDALSMAEKIEEQKKTIKKLLGSSRLRLIPNVQNRDAKSKTKVNSKHQVNETAKDEKQDFDPPKKRPRTS
ncbi:hypothetical protein IFR05_001078 [Cadophora sp. M221]|nr:hypothetical protein IFR05_001078 [Cadophora sp. M221]